MQPNWPKVVGELLAEHELAHKQQIETLAARIAELEAHPAENGNLVPPELAEQINHVRQLLEEPLPVAREVEPPRRVTGTVITRDGHLAVMYSDGTSERHGSVIGPPGPSGSQGLPGRDGVDGAKGDEGRRGRDGTSVTEIARSGNKLLFTLSDGTLRTVADEK